MQQPANFSARRRVLGLLVGSAAMLAACGGPPGGAHTLRRDDEDIEFSRFAQRGYDPAAAASAYPYRETWPYGDDEIVLNLLIPRGTAPSPLVLYLPGLGESAEAGEKWRQGWARAGYAVACVQTASGAALWSSPVARSGDFATAAQAQFAVPALNARLNMVGFVLQNIERRAKAGDGAYARIDYRRTAIAGFDLGGQTALALAGENHPGSTRPPPLASLRAALVLSPHAVIAQGGFAKRYANISLPVLTITSTEDVDPYGLVDSPHTRQAPFSYMPPGDKYLLVVEDGNHSLLSGSNGTPVPRGEADDAAPPQHMPGERREPPDGMGRFPGFGGDGPGGTGRRGGMGGPGGGMRGSPFNNSGSSRSRLGLQRQAVIIERVSLAFLDATVRNDPVAREWLERDALRWSDPFARLQMK